MHISSIVLHGFKSFGKKSTIKLGRGITGVVGPNGCGKTNIVDAIRWVLGEQKQSVIRAGRMEEIIFNGSRQHKPSSICEVSLTIHNDKGKLPTEYTDVEITRRLYRDGESEYLINRQPCRLKDITELFVDTGMGSDAYSVIELKMVEGILSEMGEERRSMFEEAAGVNKYKKQRASAFRKLEATRQDLERISDITIEVGSKVRGLELQLKRFERHHTLTQSLEEKELALARLKIDVLQGKKQPLEADLKIAMSGRDSEANEISIKEKEISDRREALVALDTLHQEARQAYNIEMEKLNEHRRQVLVWNEQIRSTQTSIERVAEERQREESSLKERETAVGDVTKELDALAPNTDNRRKSYEKKQAEEAQFTKTFKAAELELEEAREKKFSHRHQLTDATSRQERTSELIGERKAAISRIEDDIRTADAQVTDREAQQATLSGQLAEKESALAALADNAERAVREIETQQRVVDSAREKVHEAATHHKLLQTQLAMLEGLAEDMEGYPKGTRQILDSLADHPGILGTVADLAKVDAIHAKAVEIALGAAATALVSKTSADAKALLSGANDDGLGRLSVIPLDALSGASPASFVSADLKPLVEAVSVSDDLKPLFKALLDGYYLSSSADKVEIDGLPAGVTLITDDGDQYGKVPLWTHAGPADIGSSGASAAVVGRTAEIARLAGEIDRAQSAQAEAKTALDGAEGKRSDNLRENRERAELTEQATAAIIALKEELSQISYQDEQTAISRKEAAEKLPKLKSDLKEHESSLTGLTQSVAALQKSENKLNEAIGTAQETYSQAQKGLNAWREELQEQRVALINLENEREKLAERKLTLEDMIANGQKRLTNLAEEKLSREAESTDLREKVKLAATEEAALTESVRLTRVRAATEEEKVREGREAISTSEVDLRAIQHRRETALGDLQNKRLELEQFKQSEALIRSRIKELYNQTVGKLQDGDEDLSERTLQDEVDGILRSIERIGPVNMAVADEHKEEVERHGFLTDQQTDLTASEETLRETIEKIDTKARQQFQETYDSIRHHFKQTFAMFFEGGEGDLRLVGDPDPLESDIEIIAVPPGKTSRTLRSLSAGEKALTAIALLFAIYMVKPSPYCILDEVDAPLDDINIGKFSKVIAEFATDTQFIVVTHNKLSMERADYLYGVTMAEEGLSTLVSVDLHEFAA